MILRATAIWHLSLTLLLLLSSGCALFPNPDGPAEDPIVPSETESTMRTAVIQSRQIVTPVLRDEGGVELETIDSKEDIPGRTIYIEISKVEEAVEYELEVRPKEQKWIDPYYIKTNREKFRIRLSPGLYAIRTRSIAAGTTAAGEWGEWNDFTVPFKSAAKPYPEHQQVIEPKTLDEEKVTFQWPGDLSAQKYRFHLYDDQGYLLRKVETPQTWLTMSLKIGTQYTWTLQPLKESGQYDPTAKFTTNTFAITKPPPEFTPVDIQVLPRAGVKYYQFELIKTMPDESTTESSILDSPTPNFNARLGPGEYDLRVRMIFQDDTIGAWGTPTKFVVKIRQATLLSPANGRFYDPEDETVKVQFRWKGNEMAAQYVFVLYDERNHIIAKEVTTKTDVILSVANGHNYRWTVQPLLKNEEFEVPEKPVGGFTFTIGSYKRLALSQAEEPSQVYSWERWLYSDTNFKSANWDNFNRVSQPLYTSTGEASYGYWHRRTSFGFLIPVGISWIGIQDKEMFYSNQTALLGYRKVFGGDKRFRAWLGISRRGIPEVLVSPPPDNVISLKTLTTVGMEARMTWHDSLSGNWGYNIYAIMYQSLMTEETPNGHRFTDHQLYNFTSYVTYRWSKLISLMGGYTYQLEHAIYGSYDITNNSNYVELNGHYVSLSILFGLQDPQR